MCKLQVVLSWRMMFQVRLRLLENLGMRWMGGLLMAYKAKSGGEIGANGEFYKGGQFVADNPNTAKVTK